ncbi:MAG: type 1 glutamine amidotransferase domain-containing protein [Pelolinea sp.]|nr:type 1 glutamine amidotransferase domain-containing protein [Pelolinea sp.]
MLLQDLAAIEVVNGKELPINKGTMLTRVIYKYWYHNGEMQAVRQLLDIRDCRILSATILDQWASFIWIRRKTMSLSGKKIIILAENFYEDLELWYPYYRLKEEGADVKIVGMPGVENYGSKYGYPVKPDLTPQEVEIEKIDALLVPGGYAPDKLRRYPEMLELVRKAFDQGSVIGMICHAGWVPISAGIVRGKKVTSVSAIKDDMVNAGGEWLDQEVVVDGNLISSRTPADLPAYCKAIIAALNE